MRKKLEFIRKIVFYIIIAFLIFICLIMVKSKIEGKQANILGYEFYVVLTGSMEPKIDVGDLVIVKEVNTEDIKVGDIITFRGNASNSIITHRVKDIVDEDGIKFITQGDANNTIDSEPINEELLIGKVVQCVPKIGFAILKIKNNIIISVIILTAIITLVSRFFCDVDKLLKKEKDKAN